MSHAQGDEVREYRRSPEKDGKMIGLKATYRMTGHGTDLFLVCTCMVDQSVDKGITCYRYADEEVAVFLRYHVHELQTQSRLIVCRVMLMIHRE